LRYFIDLSFNGKNYHGWQHQPDTVTVQDILEQALSTILRETIKITGAGRTDTGVHAKQMIAHFDYKESDNLTDTVYKLNSFLPKDIAIKKIIPVKEDSHARFDAFLRTYEYRITNEKNPFLQDYAYFLHHLPDINKMNEASNILLSYKDFQCFSRSKTDVKTYHCTINEANWTMDNKHLTFTITADRFLRNMVRAIVGTLLDIGNGTISTEDLHAIIKSKNRSNAGTSVPAHGLFLTKVTYPKEIIK